MGIQRWKMQINAGESSSCDYVKLTDHNTEIWNRDRQIKNLEHQVGELEDQVFELTRQLAGKE